MNSAGSTAVVTFGCLMLAAGLGQVAHALHVRDWSGFFLYLLDGLVRAAMGTVVLAFPSSGADDLVLILSLYLFVSGVGRGIGSLALEFPGWHWAATSGLLEMAVAAMLAIEWPSNSRFLIGFAVSMDLILYVWSLVMYLVAARDLAPSRA